MTIISSSRKIPLQQTSNTFALNHPQEETKKKETMNTIMNYNSGVGLQMTSTRQSICYEQCKKNKDTPSPQSYNVEFKLTDREKRQNALISRRYDNWKKKEDYNNNMMMTIIR